MKKLKKILMLVCCMTMTFALTGCGTTKELKQAYNKMKIGEKEGQINGYTLSVRLFGVYNDKKVNESIRVSNYLNKDFKVVLDDYTYYLIDGVKYKTESERRLDFSSRLESRKNNENNYSKIDEDIPFTDTGRYLLPLKSIKADDVPVKESIGELEYSTYTYSVKKNAAQKLLADTSIADEKLTANVPAKVWINSDGYVYKVEYDISAGYKTSSSLLLTLYYNGVDNASSIRLDPRSFDLHEEMVEE